MTTVNAETTTPKGERRRERLAQAAAGVLEDDGHGRLRHRRVAERAGLPLAATTYYFESLDDLFRAGAEAATSADIEAICARTAEISRRRRRAASAAEVLVHVLLGDSLPPVVARYERQLGGARNSALIPGNLRTRRTLAAAAATVLDLSARRADAASAAAVLAVIDGEAVAALGAGSPTPLESARHALAAVIDVIAPAA